ncbi:MAG: chemotaxis protein CheW [Sulfuricurvum sp.]
MTDYIIFSIKESKYALEVSKIERIDQVPHFTPIPNAHPHVEGMMQYRDHTVKVVNFRKMTDVITYENQMLLLFNQVIKDHQTWVEKLKDSLETGNEFTLALDPHMCRLGKWLYSYSTHDPEVLAILRILIPVHARLHTTGSELLMQYHAGDKKKALERYEQEILGEILITTMKELQLMLTKANDISAHAQKLLIYRYENEFIAIKVDAINDMAAFNEADIKPYAHHISGKSHLKTRELLNIKAL